MHTSSLSRTLVSLAVVSSLYACGGSSSTITPLSEVTDQDNSVNQIPTANGAADATLTGRVADGYIRGATVCIDLNENGSCDADEPVATTGDGGVYELTLADGAQGKPILADIPATAIDEDDNMPIGKRMMFSAPPSQREFISPITTLVQQELENNPSVDIAEAEASVKQELGLSTEDDDASLFTDYVAEGDDADSGDKAERFRHMHRTAQVVARMMQEIQDSAESAVVAQGIDLEGDPATRKALHKAVRTEIRKLLPEIAQAVSKEISAVRNSADADGETGSGDIDPEALARKLIPAEEIEPDDVLAERDLPRVETVTVEAMLKDGFYFFDVGCSVHEVYDDEAFTDSVTAPEFHCAAGYTHISLAEDGVHIDETEYEYDQGSSGWIAIADESDDHGDGVLQLLDGQWVSSTDGGKATVEFSADGGAVVTHSDGAMVIKAVQRSLAGQHITRHLYEFDTPDRIITDEETLFPADSSEYLFKIKRKDSQYALFNWSGDADGDCAEHNGNCNVVNRVTDDGLTAVKTLDALTGGNGTVLAGLLHSEYDQSLDVELLPISDGDEWGKAQWVAKYFQHFPEHFEGMPECPPEEIKLYEQIPESTRNESGEADGELPTKVDLDTLQLLNDEAIDEVPASIEGGRCKPQESDVVLYDDTQDSTGKPAHDDFGYGRWRIVTVDDVKMIELTVPFALRYQIDFDDSGSVMLIEHDGFVRRGAHFSNRAVETETAYNPVAFESLLTGLQELMSDAADTDADSIER